MRYTVVDRYHRQKHFDYYRQYRNPFYSMTFELDATELKRFTARHGYRTYLNLCYFFTRAMRGIEDFRYRLRNDKLVLYEEIHPGLTVPAADGTYSWASFEYDPDVHRFNEKAEARWPEANASPDLTPAEHENQIYFTAIPGVAFTGLTHTWNDPAEGAPRVAFGNLIERGDRRVVPVGIQVNHCFIDGRALGELTRRVQEEYGRPG